MPTCSRAAFPDCLLWPVSVRDTVFNLPPRQTQAWRESVFCHLQFVFLMRIPRVLDELGQPKQWWKSTLFTLDRLLIVRLANSCQWRIRFQPHKRGDCFLLFETRQYFKVPPPPPLHQFKFLRLLYVPSRCKMKKILRSAYKMYLYVLYGSRNKFRSLSYEISNYCFIQRRWGRFTARYELNIIILIRIFIYCNWVVTRWQWLFYM